MADENPDPDEFIDLANVDDPMIAQMLKSHLEAVGIPVIVPGAYPKHDAVLLGQALGIVGCTLRVPRRHVEAAQRVLEESRRAGEDLERAGPDGDDEVPDSA
ncbi:MAG: hypothetical protein CMJ83_12240 [Planctomycetes bacterium]|nr:hypothetical protein [Planctomycetota bacterium]